MITTTMLQKKKSHSKQICSVGESAKFIAEVAPFLHFSGLAELQNTS